MITEDQLENLCQTWFEGLGYAVIDGTDIAPDSDNPEREDWREVILKPRLQAAIDRINAHLPPAAREDALHQVINCEEPALIASNRAFHRLLVDGVNVDIEGKEVTEGVFVRLIDFDNPVNNDWLVVRQFTVIGSHTRRPDMVVFLNGLPLAVIELKNPANEKTDVWEAYNQLETYKEQISDLFIANAALVISDGVEARVGSLTASRERYLPWHSISGERGEDIGKLELEVLVRGLFAQHHLLDYLRFFVIFEESSGKTIKKIAGYHQFFAVRAATENPTSAIPPKSGHSKSVLSWLLQSNAVIREPLKIICRMAAFRPLLT